VHAVGCVETCVKSMAVRVVPVSAIIFIDSITIIIIIALHLHNHFSLV
jgi:hypothetical protein